MFFLNNLQLSIIALLIFTIIFHCVVNKLHDIFRYSKICDTISFITFFYFVFVLFCCFFTRIKYNFAFIFIFQMHKRINFVFILYFFSFFFFLQKGLDCFLLSFDIKRVGTKKQNPTHISKTLIENSGNKKIRYPNTQINTFHVFEQAHQ